MNHIRYTILSELRLIIEYYAGSIKMEDIISFKKEICEQQNYSPKFDVIMDFQDANLNFDLSKLTDYFDFAHSFNKILGERKTGFVTSKPNEVVLTTMFGHLKGNLPIDSKTFSTLKATFEWLDTPLEKYEYIEQKLVELKQ